MNYAPLKILIAMAHSFKMWLCRVLRLSQFVTRGTKLLQEIKECLKMNVFGDISDSVTVSINSKLKIVTV